MKPRNDKLVVVTATANIRRATQALRTWQDRASLGFHTVIVINGETHAEGIQGVVTIHPGKGFLGVVPAFALGVAQALDLHPQPEIIACFHDDLLIQEDGWDVSVLNMLSDRPGCGLTGFGGGQALGDQDIYQVDYAAIQLARQGFLSNMQDAELHGRRSTGPARLACLDGFSQIGRREYWEGHSAPTLPPGTPEWDNSGPGEWLGQSRVYPNLFQRMADLGIIHHCYDAALGCYAKRLGWEVWLTPVYCHHQGGQTAVADTRYQEWAKTQHPDGDQGFWTDAHRAVYDEFRDILPILMED